VDKALSPQAEKTALDSSKPSSSKGAQDSPGAGGALTSPTRATRIMTLQAPPRCRDQPSPLERLTQAPDLMDSGPPVSISVVRARLRHNLRRFRDSAHGS
jgi:hypothetical protein